MKKMRKIILISLMLLLLACSFLFIGCNCSCNGDSDDGVDTTPPTVEEVKVRISPETCELVLHEVMQFKAIAKDEQATIVWSSENSEIVTITDDGLATALKAGETYVVATVGEDSAKCFVRVIESEQIAVIKIGGIIGDSFNIYNGDTFTPELSVYFDGTKMENVEFTITAKKDGVVTVTGQNIKGVAVGSCELEISAKSNGVELVGANRVITVNVIEQSYLSLSEASVNLYAIDSLGANTYQTEKTVTAKLFVNGQMASADGITWESDNESVATVDQNGKITAKSVGTAKITAKCQNKVSGVDVNVDYAILEKTGEPILVDNRDLQAVNELDVFGDGTEIKAIYDVTTEQDIEKLQPVDLTKKAITGDRTLLFCNDKYAIQTPAKVGDYVIYDSEDFVNVVKTATEGYIVLGADINDPFTIGRGNEHRIQFDGVMDGNHHVINSISISGESNAMFWRFGLGTIKDLYIRKATLGGSQTGVLICQLNLGSAVVENVTIGEVEFNDGAAFQGAMVANFISGAIYVKDSLVIANITNANKQGALAGKDYLGNATIDNSYFITNGKLVSEVEGNNDNAPYTNEKALPYEVIDPIDAEIAGSNDVSVTIPQITTQINKVYLGETPVDFTQSGSTLSIPNDQVKGDAKLVVCTADGAFVSDFKIKYTKLTSIIKDSSISGGFDLNLPEINSTINRVNVNGSDIEFTVSGTRLLVSESTKNTIGDGTHNVVIFTDAKTYELQLTLATIIDNATEMKTLFFTDRVTYENKYFILNADLSAMGVPSAGVDGMFLDAGKVDLINCTFDGKGHKISDTTFRYGLFRNIQGTTVKNLIFENVGLTVGEFCGVVSLLTGNSIIENVSVNVTKLNKPADPQKPMKQSGGLVGMVNNGSLTLNDVLVKFDGETTNNYLGVVAGRHNKGAGDVIMNGNCFFVSANLPLCAPTTDLVAENYKTDQLNGFAENRLFKTVDLLKAYVSTNNVKLTQVQLAVLDPQTSVVGGGTSNDIVWEDEVYGN